MDILHIALLFATIFFFYRSNCLHKWSEWEKGADGVMTRQCRKCRKRQRIDDLQLDLTTVQENYYSIVNSKKSHNIWLTASFKELHPFLDTVNMFLINSKINIIGQMHIYTNNHTSSGAQVYFDLDENSFRKLAEHQTILKMPTKIRLKNGDTVYRTAAIPFSKFRAEIDEISIQRKKWDDENHRSEVMNGFIKIHGDTPSISQ